MSVLSKTRKCGRFFSFSPVLYLLLMLIGPPTRSDLIRSGLVWYLIRSDQIGQNQTRPNPDPLVSDPIGPDPIKKSIKVQQDPMSWAQSKGSCWILKTNLDKFFGCFWQKCVNFHLFCWKICKYPLRSFKNPLLSFKIQRDPSNSIGSYWIWFGPISDPIGSNRILSFKIRPDQTQ